MLALLRSRRFAPLFWTQLLGAFNDNVFKSALVVALTFGAFRDGAALETDALVNLATALLVLPFFLFSAFAGQLADRLDKATLTRALKATELGVMLLALVGFQLASLPLLAASARPRLTCRMTSPSSSTRRPPYDKGKTRTLRS